MTSAKWRGLHGPITAVDAEAEPLHRRLFPPDETAATPPRGIPRGFAAVRADPPNETTAWIWIPSKRGAA